MVSNAERKETVIKVASATEYLKQHVIDFVKGKFSIVSFCSAHFLCGSAKQMHIPNSTTYYPAPSITALR